MQRRLASRINGEKREAHLVELLQLQPEALCDLLAEHLIDYSIHIHYEIILNCIDNNQVYIDWYKNGVMSM